MTLGYTTQVLNLFNSYSFFNMGLTHALFFLLKILNILIYTQGKGEKILKKFIVVYIQNGLTLVIYIVENEFRLGNDMYSLIGHPLLNFLIFCVQMLMACTH